MSTPPFETGFSLPPNDAATVRSSAVAKLRRAASIPRNKDGRRTEIPKVSFPPTESGEPLPPPPAVIVVEASPNIKTRESTEDLEQGHLSEESKRSKWADDQANFHSFELESSVGAEAELGKEILTEDQLNRSPPSTMSSLPTSSHNVQEETQVERQQVEDGYRPSRLPTLMQRSASSSSQNSSHYPQRFPALPSLSDIQSRHLLQRSNSASARQDALSRLTGVPPPPSTSPAPPVNSVEQSLHSFHLSGISQSEGDSMTNNIPSLTRPRLGRSFTIGGSHPGGERRSVVGRRMMARLGSRTDGGSTSSTSPSLLLVPETPRSRSPSPALLNLISDESASPDDPDNPDGKHDGDDRAEQVEEGVGDHMGETDREEILLPSISSARSAAFTRSFENPTNSSTFLERNSSRPFMSHGYSFSESLPSSRSGSPHPFPDYTRPSRLGSISVTQPSTLSNSGRLSNASSLTFDRQWAPSPDTGEPTDAFEFSDLLRSNSSRTARSVSPRLPIVSDGTDGRRERHLGVPSLPRSQEEGLEEVEVLTSSVRSVNSSCSQNNQFSAALRTTPSIITTTVNNSSDNDRYDSDFSNDGSSRDVSKVHSRSNASPSHYSTPTSEFSPSIPILPPGLTANLRGLGPDGVERGNLDRSRTGSGDSFPASVAPRDEHKARARSVISGSPADEDQYQDDREVSGQDEFLTPLESVESFSRPGSASIEIEQLSKMPSSALLGTRRDDSPVSSRGPDERSIESGTSAALDYAMSWASVGENASSSAETDKKHGHKKSLSFVEKLERIAKGTFRSRSSSSSQSSHYQPRSPALETRDPLSSAMNRSTSKSTLRSSGSSSGQRRTSSHQTLEDRTSGLTVERHSTSQPSGGLQPPSQSVNSSPTFGSRLPPPSPTEPKYSDAKLMPFPGIVQLEIERDRKRERSIGSVSPSIDRYVSSDAGTPASYVSPFEVTGDFESTLSPGISPVAYFDLSPRPPSPNSKKSWLSRKFSTGAFKGLSEDRRKVLNSPDDHTRVIDGGMLGRELSASPKASPHSFSSASRFSSPKESSSLFATTPHSPSPSSPQNSEPSRQSVRSSPPLTHVNTFPAGSTHLVDTISVKSATTSTLPKVKGILSSAGLTTVTEPSEEETPRPSTSSFDMSRKTYRAHSLQETVQPMTILNGQTGSSSEAQQETRTNGAPSLLDLYSKNSEGDYQSASLHQKEDQPTWEQTEEKTMDTHQESQREVTASSPSSFETRSAQPLTLSPQTAQILGRLDSVLALASTQQSTSSQLNDPPRKLLLHSPVLQVVNANAAKDRYLFLFTDVLVIAKPILSEGQMPSLDNKFIVKSIVELPKLKLSGLKDGDATSDSMKKQHPIVLNFIQIFSQDPHRAVEYLISQSNLSSASISGFLFKTTEIDRTKLGEFLSQEVNERLLEGFVARFSFAGVRIDEALRTFLLSIRLPTEANANERLLWTFAAQWHEVNSEVVPFSKQVSIQLVLAIMQLNDALNPSSSGFGTFAFANQAITVDDFIQAFRVHDSRRLVTNKYLESLYISIKKEKLSQALSSSESHLQRDIYLLPSQLPSKLTYMVPSELIYITMPEMDPNLVIRLHGTGLTFDPPVLTFTQNSRASFTVTGTSLGTKTMLISRTGDSSPLYNSLPTSKTFLVERAFQRAGHTFQLSFIREPTNQKRKYLISFESSSTQLQWAGSIQGQIRRSTAALEYNIENELLPVSVQKAARTVALQVLRDALVAPESDTSKGVSGLQKVPSFSQIYPLRAGRCEIELNEQLGSTKSTKAPSQNRAGGGKTDLPTVTELEERAATTFFTARTGHEIIRECQQNSLVPLMLSFLQAGLKPIDLPAASHAVSLGIDTLSAPPGHRGYGYF
ncbi:Pattern-formation protein/guanine nucleotide exchange factor [Phaffia rhodozyma]|uniref:Pattern-formation protein/guanine nucleotide exchange factor n=1 Tax=Phaffia rhodozyma TaxID=264483 RepID=A0A0F7SIQ7_PHARH|nr:Pattern-formation protein/guanine nucleotide exchange factor [Phaffia rhodozyma]